MTCEGNQASHEDERSSSVLSPAPWKNAAANHISNSSILTECNISAAPSACCCAPLNGARRTLNPKNRVELSQAVFADGFDPDPNLNGCCLLTDIDIRRDASATAAQSYVGALSNELARKAALFEDDTAFVVEVQEGRSPAPGMDPASELKTLKARFAVFKRDFKVARLSDLHIYIIIIYRTPAPCPSINA